MADVASDSPLSHPQPGRNQRTVPAASTTQKRNNRSHRKNNNTTQFDGAVSDGAAAMPIPSPQSRKSQRQQSMSSGAPPVQQPSAGLQHAQNSRPVPVPAGLQPDTPAKSFEQAYAGATFSNSPAPSSLPVPRFFSKSVPNVARPPSAHQRPASQTQPQPQPQYSPESDPASPAAAPEPPQSPLDLFFKADRKEKESRHLSQSSSPNVTRNSPFSGSGNSYQQSSKSVKSIFLSELDGNDTNLPSPRTIPPGGRPPPAERALSSPQVPLRASQSEDERIANTRSLKELLFNTAANSSMTPPTPQTRSGRNSGSQTPEGVFGPPSPLNGSGPSTPRPSSEQQNHYSLHYGNRNLSPLFKAARTDTPPRPSSLRQEFPKDFSSAFGQSIPPQSASADTDTFARTYLKDQIRTHGPAEMPSLSFNSGLRPTPAAGNISSNRAVPNTGQPVYPQHRNTQSAASPRAGSRDVQAMENDLRRMLKLNV